jgi:hypothetical protein
MVIMRMIVSALVATTPVAGMAMPTSAAPRERDRTKINGHKSYGYNSDANGKGGPCVVTSWIVGATTKPIFTCPGERGYPGQAPAIGQPACLILKTKKAKAIEHPTTAFA